MKIDLFETHDRYKEFTNKSFDIGECCQDLINQRPFGSHPFYIFAHTRTEEDGYTKRLIWQPRLTRPKPQTNSMLFKAYPGSDNIRVCWMIPSRELFDQYKKGNVTEHDVTRWSIDQFENNRAALEAKEEDDLTDEQIDAIYRDLSIEAKRKKAMDKLYLKLDL